MFLFWLILHLYRAALCLELNIKESSEEAFMKTYVTPLDEMKNVAHWGDAEHRGPAWYDASTAEVSRSELHSGPSDTSTSIETDSSTSSTTSSGASSFETDLEKIATRNYRTCTPCPHDMIKKHTNIGIKWICGGYQRARRSFKSECMMRYRNCEDGTMFIKLADHKCQSSSFHGRHWFYDYKV